MRLTGEDDRPRGRPPWADHRRAARNRGGLLRSASSASSSGRTSSRGGDDRHDRAGARAAGRSTRQAEAPGRKVAVGTFNDAQQVQKSTSSRGTAADLVSSGSLLGVVETSRPRPSPAAPLPAAVDRPAALRLRVAAVVTHQREEVLPETMLRTPSSRRPPIPSRPPVISPPAVFHVGSDRRPRPGHVSKCGSRPDQYNLPTSAHGSSRSSSAWERTLRARAA